MKLDVQICKWHSRYSYLGSKDKLLLALPRRYEAAYMTVCADNFRKNYGIDYVLFNNSYMSGMELPGKSVKYALY